MKSSRPFFLICVSLLCGSLIAQTGSPTKAGTRGTVGLPLRDFNNSGVTGTPWVLQGSGTGQQLYMAQFDATLTTATANLAAFTIAKQVNSSYTLNGMILTAHVTTTGASSSAPITIYTQQGSCVVTTSSQTCSWGSTTNDWGISTSTFNGTNGMWSNINLEVHAVASNTGQSVTVGQFVFTAYASSNSATLGISKCNVASCPIPEAGIKCILTDANNHQVGTCPDDSALSIEQLISRSLLKYPSRYVRIVLRTARSD